MLDEVDKALEAANRAIALAPDDPRPLATASRALTLLGRHEEAVTMAYRAVIVEPKNPLWHDRVAWSLLAADRQYADAEQAARTAIGLDPDEAHYYFTHGVTLDALGHADQARQAFLISLRLEPENPVAQHRLAVLNGESVRRREAGLEALRPAARTLARRLFGRGGNAASSTSAAAITPANACRRAAPGRAGRPAPGPSGAARDPPDGPRNPPLPLRAPGRA